MNCRILQGTVFERLPEIEPGSIDCAVTSPPYWMLRNYLPKGHPLKALELGQEPTPQEYVANVVKWCGLVRTCLAVHATLWLNVGDTYSANRSYQVPDGKWEDVGNSASMNAKKIGIEAGNLCLIPQRLMIALQEDGWLVRSVVVWHKPATMPISVTGWRWQRCRVKAKGFWDENNPHPSKRASGGMNSGVENSGGFKTAAEWEDCPGCKRCEPNGGLVLRRGSWRPTSSYEPVIMLAKTSSYFCDGDAVKTPPKESTVERDRYTRVIDDPDEQYAVEHDHETICDGANLRDVWTIPFEPLKEAHYAAYPTELVFRCLSAGTSSEGYCDKCGAPFARVVAPGDVVSVGGSNAGKMSDNATKYGDLARTKCKALEQRATVTTGWRASCKCENPTPRPGRVLDPFCGSGRTGIVARRMGLDFTGVELSPDYAALGRKMLANDAPLFNDFGD